MFCVRTQYVLYIPYIASGIHTQQKKIYIYIYIQGYARDPLRLIECEILLMYTCIYTPTITGGEAATFGASMLRSYQEEQRLVTENALVRSQLDALRRQCAQEGEWRSDARQLQGRISGAGMLLWRG